MGKIVIEENISKDNDFIKSPTTSGYFITEFERLLEIDVGREAAENIISNSIKCNESFQHFLLLTTNKNVSFSYFEIYGNIIT